MAHQQRGRGAEQAERAERGCVCVCVCVCVCMRTHACAHSVISGSLRPHGLWPTRLLCPWDFPVKNTGVGSHFLLQQIFLTQGSNPGPLHRQVGSISTEPPEKLKASWGTNVRPRNFVHLMRAQRRGLQSRRSGSLLGCRVGVGSPGRGHRLCSLAWRWEEHVCSGNEAYD